MFPDWLQSVFAVANLISLVYFAWQNYQLYKKPRPCRHEWKRIAAQHVDHASSIFSGGGLATIVLVLCTKCGENSTGSYPGKWSLEEMNGKTSVDQLKELYDR